MKIHQPRKLGGRKDLLTIPVVGATDGAGCAEKLRHAARADEKGVYRVVGDHSRQRAVAVLDPNARRG